MKQKITFKLCLAMLGLLLSFSAGAITITIGQLEYTLYDNGAASVAAADKSTISGEIVIPASVENYNKTYSVKAIGYWAFYGCSGLTAITIPNSVTIIDNNAFYNCSGLTAITIPNSVTTISESAFNGTRLKEFIVAKDNPNYSSLDGILYNKQQTEIIQVPPTIKSVNIPNSVTTIGNSAFNGCKRLTTITIPNSVTTIGNNAFYNCSRLTAVTIPNSVTTISQNAFYNCSGLTAITIPNSVTTIGEDAFSYCSGLTAITIPNSVTTIGNWAFSYCSGLTAITIPNSVTTIGNYAFRSCSGLTAITIGNSVTTIGERAFYNCSGLTAITIPNSVKTIDNYAFFGCTGLQEIKVYAEEPIDIDEGVFQYVNYNTCKLYVPKGSIEKYQAAYMWDMFSTILALADGSAIEGVDEDKLNVYSIDGKVVIKNLREGEAISICNTTGQNVYQGNETEVPLSKGIYFVKVGTIVSKVMVQ